MRPAAHLLAFASPKESRQRKGDPAVRDPSASLRGNLWCSRMGCAVELTARLRRFVQTTTASQFKKHGRFDAHAHPMRCAPRHGQKGGGTTRAIAALGLVRGASSAGPSAAMARVGLFTPLWLRLGRGAFGVSVGVAAPTHRCLTCRGCLNGAPQARSEFCGTPRKRPDPGLPRSAAKGSQTWGRVLCLLSCTSKKGGRPPGRDPASKHQEEELLTQYQQALEAKINWNLTPINAGAPGRQRNTSKRQQLPF